MVGRICLMNRFIPYAKQSITAEDIDNVSDALKQDIITRGPIVESFEKALADYCGAAHAVAFNSGTSALQAAYFAADIGPHDRCLTTPNTFIATSGMAASRKAHPVFIDIDRNTGNLDLQQLAYNLEDHPTRGKTVILPVHFSGIAVDIEKIDASIIDPWSVIIEDAAHALGSQYKNGMKVGCCAWSQMTMFSFHPAKQITTGEGGMVLTNDPDLAYRLRLFRDNGIERTDIPGYYEVHDLTGNFHMTDFQAALGLSQLQRLDRIVDKRRQLIKAYREQLENVPHLSMLSADFDLETSFHLCVTQIDFEAHKTSRENVMRKLKETGIGTQVHYIPLYRHPVFEKTMGDISEYFPQTEAYYAQELSLPLFEDLSFEEVTYVCDTLKTCLKG